MQRKADGFAPTRRRLALALVVLGLLGALTPVVGAEAAPAAPPDESTLGHKLLMYLPNRLYDLRDLVRARLRLGLGLAAGVRLTEHGGFYAGQYQSVYAGLPGPRRSMEQPTLVGREDLKGIILAGVDATDDTPYHPGYSVSEVEASAHLLLIGADVGLDPIEFWDLLAGFFLIDPAGDDL